MGADIWDVPLVLEFVECDTCRAKSGSPTLCMGCLRNRALIEALTARIKPKAITEVQADAARRLWPQR